MGASANAVATAPAKHCLVVDDSKVIRMVARRILEGLNFSISEAADGKIALDGTGTGSDLSATVAELLANASTTLSNRR